MMTLYLFDLDGTLVHPFTADFRPGVLDWFATHAVANQIAIATNQGGVGLRHWMEDGHFGEPDKYPTEDQARAHVEAISAALPGGPYPVFMAFAYQSQKSGKWAPAPAGCEDDPEWSQEWRKPAPGMIFEAMRRLECSRAKTVMVGDWREDQEAAENAGVGFVWAVPFFGFDGAAET